MQQLIAQWLVENQGEITESGELNLPAYVQQLAAVEAGQAYSLLSKYALLHIHGEDATTFLQGQFSCDVAAISAGGVTLGSYSNAKGRMQATFILAGVDGQYYLLLRKDIAEGFRRRLSMFVLRAKVKIDAVTEQYALWLLQDAQAVQPALLEVGEAGLNLSIGHGLVLRLQRQPQSVNWQQGLQPVGSAAADYVFIRAGLGWVSQATFEEFVPQMLNLELLGGVSFKKGCYPGQEIVARTQYLGKVKRRLYRANVRGASVNEGAAIITAATGDQVIGRVVLSAKMADGSVACLLVLQHTAWEGQPVLQDNPQAVIEKLSLPYNLPDAD
jgi:folate-binding protein YgfZ